MSICIFPGTFNPIHNAHLKMAEFALAEYGFEKIIFVPSYIPPHKNIDKDSAKHRFNMVKLAISEHPKFEISDIEYKSEGKSYSYNTVKQIIKDYNVEGRLNFIIGTDAFEKIRTWYKVDDLKKLVHFIVFPRGFDKINPKEFSDFSYEFAQMGRIDISSTELREAHKYEITEKKVKEYIDKYELYS